ncbi:MAG: precorrin-4 C(11)-methyltransferase [Spirochaetia bacterium]|nr:precorrin-4 C(11)-methyltransferase [Spirochaetia bacterium]
MKVYVIGAGPGDPELITVKGQRLISECQVIIYTGSLVPEELLQHAKPNAEILDSASMTLDQIVEEVKRCKEADLDVARVHTGDPSLFSSVAEQLRRFRDIGISYEIIPGVSSFSAASAALEKELTLPELSQTVIISRVEGRTPMPEKERLSELAVHGSTMVFFLSAGLVKKITRELIPHYGEDCPAAIVFKASHPDQMIIRGHLGDIEEKWRQSGIKSQCIIIVGQVLESEDFADSRLYAADFKHGFRR